MSSGYFKYNSPRDILEKAKREYDKMILGLIDTDKVFNFFVTAWAVKDYIESQGVVNKSEIKKLYDDEDFKKCQFLCNKGKHLNKKSKFKNLNSKTKIKYSTEIFSGTVGGAPLNELAINDEDKYVISCDHLSVNVKALGKNILNKWEDFFKKNSI